MNCSKISPNDLSNEAFFGKGRNFFIWIKSKKEDEEKIEGELDETMHFYHLKKLCRKKDQPLYAYCIEPQDFIDNE